MISYPEVDPQIMTVLGPVKMETLLNLSAVLSHEHLIQNLSRKYTGEQTKVDSVSLENLNYVNENPYSNLNNLALNATEEICTELKNTCEKYGGPNIAINLPVPKMAGT